MRKINEIIIHCSDTQEGCDVTAADIRRWHTTPKEKGGRGWRDIGYHYVIRLDGTIEVGRTIERVGAHCIGRNGEDHNSHSIGICYIGGRHMKEDGTSVWADTRTAKQKDSMAKLVMMLLALLATLSLMLLIYRKSLREFDAKLQARLAQGLTLVPVISIPYKAGLTLLILSVLAIASHHQTETLLEREKNSVLLVMPLICAGIVMSLKSNRARH